MQKEPISPVTEVTLFLAREKIRERVEARARDVMRANTPIYGSASAIRTVPPFSPPSEARIHVEDHDVIDISNDDGGCSSDDSQRTMAYPDPTTPCTNTDMPTAKTVQPAINGDRYGRFQIPAFAASNVAPAHSDIPQSLVQAYLQAKRARAHDGTTGLEPGMCTNNQCPFCKGGLLRQYYSLMERLVQLDIELNHNP